MQSQARHVGLDGLRGVAAIAVVLYHYTQGTYHLFPSAPAAVDFFFVLSGFVLASAYGSKLGHGMTPWHFMRLRLLRLYPLYLVGTLLGLAALSAGLYGGANTQSGWMLLSHFALALLFLPGPTGMGGTLYPLDGPAWSLFFELVANGLFAAVRFKTPMMIGICGLTALGYGAIVCATGVDAGWQWATALGGVPRVLFSFYLGVLLQGIGSLRSGDRLPSYLPSLVLVLAFSLPHAVPTYLAVILFLSPALILAQVGSEPAGKFRSLCSWLGGNSYALYVVHQPLYDLAHIAMQWLKGIATPELPVSWMLGTLACALLLSHVLTKHVDGPLRRWLSRLWRARADGNTSRPARYRRRYP